MESKLKKYNLPPFAELTHIKVDLDRLRYFFQESVPHFSDVIQSNQGLCGVHPELVNSVYDNFEQVSLTTLHPDSAQAGENVSGLPCEEIEKNLSGGDFSSKSSRVRMRKRLSQENSILNEHSYDFKTDLLKGSYVEEILSQFKGTPTRVRLVKLRGNSTVPPHIDYDPSYAVRVIIPIIADEFCVNSFWVRKKIYSTFFEPGKVYFLNTGFHHSVVNFSKKDRVTLMLSLKGQEDIQDIAGGLAVQC